MSRTCRRSPRLGARRSTSFARPPGRSARVRRPEAPARRGPADRGLAARSSAAPARGQRLAAADPPRLDLTVAVRAVRRLPAHLGARGRQLLHARRRRDLELRREREPDPVPDPDPDRAAHEHHRRRRSRPRTGRAPVRAHPGLARERALGRLRGLLHRRRRAADEYLDDGGGRRERRRARLLRYRGGAPAVALATLYSPRVRHREAPRSGRSSRMSIRSWRG